MKLCELLKNLEYEVLNGDLCREITGLSRDNRKARPGDLFICTEGARFDTHDAEVVKALSDSGTAAFLVEKDVTVPEHTEAVFVKVASTRKAGAFLYDAWYGHPAENMILLGIIGSKGKTTTAHMIYRILTGAGKKAGLIGTNGVDFAGRHYDLRNTTPDYDETPVYLSEMKEAGVQICVFEVSSQAMKLHRVLAYRFSRSVFLNIQEGDHVGPNEHETFAEYLDCKVALLNQSEKAFVYGDDSHIGEIRERLFTPATFFGERPENDVYAEKIEEVFDEEKKTPGIRFLVSGEKGGSFFTNFPGRFNVMNALAAILVCRDVGCTDEEIAFGLGDLRIRGRNDIVYDGDFKVVVDFAHNGASTYSHLLAMRAFSPKRLVCVFGADGNRSMDRRIGMGEAAGKMADLSIVTSGHNRFETFEQILEGVKIGLHRSEDPKYIAIKDREEAIRYAISHAEPGDLITIIGLGHENWQEENGKKRQYSDIDFVKKVIKETGR